LTSEAIVEDVTKSQEGPV